MFMINYLQYVLNTLANFFYYKIYKYCLLPHSNLLLLFCFPCAPLSTMRFFIKIYKYFHYIFQIVRTDTPRCIKTDIRRCMDSTVCRNKTLRNFLEHWLRLLKIATIPCWLWIHQAIILSIVITYARLLFADAMPIESKKTKWSLLGERCTQPLIMHN